MLSKVLLLCLGCSCVSQHGLIPVFITQLSDMQEDISSGPFGILHTLCSPALSQGPARNLLADFWALPLCIASSFQALCPEEFQPSQQPHTLISTSLAELNYHCIWAPSSCSTTGEYFQEIRLDDCDVIVALDLCIFFPSTITVLCSFYSICKDSFFKYFVKFYGAFQWELSLVQVTLSWSEAHV